MAIKSAPSYASYQLVDANKSTLRTYLAPYIHKWPWYVLAVGLAVAGAYAYLLYKQPIYRIQASLMVQDEKRGSQQTNPLKEVDAYTPKKVIENELEVLRSSTLMGRVVDNLHLDVKYYRQGRFSKREIYTESPVILLIESAQPALYKKAD